MSVTVHRVVAAYEQAQEEDYEGIEAYVPRVGYEKDEIFRYQDTWILRNYLLSFGQKSRHSKLKGLCFYSG